MLCRTDLAHNIQETLFTVPFPAALIARTGENAYLLRGMVDLRERELLSGRQGEALEQARRELEEERADCMVMDEFPYWANGAGMTNKK